MTYIPYFKPLWRTLCRCRPTSKTLHAYGPSIVIYKFGRLLDVAMLETGSMQYQVLVTTKSIRLSSLSDVSCSLLHFSTVDPNFINQISKEHLYYYGQSRGHLVVLGGH